MYDSGEGSYLGYGTNEYVKPYEGVKRRVDLLNFYTSTILRELWALSLGLIRNADMTVKYNKNYVVTKDGMEYHKGDEDVFRKG